MPTALRRLAPCVALLLLLAGCGAPPEDGGGPSVELPALETKADSVAMTLVDGHGGLAAWASAPYLRFDFGIDRGETQQVAARHLWNRQTGDYRAEWTQGEDSTYVALFNVDMFGEGASEPAGTAGEVYLNGTAVADSSAHAQLMQTAQQRFVNDSYWLLAPLKVFDPGVNRSYVADSSTATHDVLSLTFGAVGLTPGDQYWLYVNKETGQLDRWAFRLQSMGEDAAPRFFDWTDYQDFDVPAGTVSLSARKSASGGPFAIVFPALEVPSSVDDALFTDPQPRLTE